MSGETITSSQAAQIIGVSRASVNQLVRDGELTPLNGYKNGRPYEFDRAQVDAYASRRVTSDGLLTTAEAAARAGKGRSCVRTAVESGELVAILAPNPVGGRMRWLFDPAAVDAWIANRKAQSDANGRYWRISYPCVSCSARVTRAGAHCSTCCVKHKRERDAARVAAYRERNPGPRLNRSCAGGCGQPVRQQGARCVVCRRKHLRERWVRVSRERRAAGLDKSRPIRKREDGSALNLLTPAGSNVATPKPAQAVNIVAAAKAKLAQKPAPLPEPKPVPPRPTPPPPPPLSPRELAIAAGRAAWESGKYKVTPPDGKPIADPRGFWLVSGPKGFRHVKVGAALEAGERPIEVHRLRPGCGWESQPLNVKPTPPKEKTSNLVVSALGYRLERVGGRG